MNRSIAWGSVSLAIRMSSLFLSVSLLLGQAPSGSSPSVANRAAGPSAAVRPARNSGTPKEGELVKAVKERDSEAVRSLLKQHVDVNVPQADGATALAWAVYWDDLETAELLIRASANVNAANDYGVTPLSLACTNGNTAMIERLLAAGANANAAQWTGETPLMTCARGGNVEGVKSLLARGADVNAKETRRGQTPLMWAVVQKHPEVTRVLIDHGASVNAKSHPLPDFQPITYAVYGANRRVPGTLARLDPVDASSEAASPGGGFTPLMFAARAGDLDSARMLLAAGANVNETTPKNGNALVIASASGHEALAILLLEHGADSNAVDARGVTALHYAVRMGMEAINGVPLKSSRLPWPDMPYLVKALLAHGANPNARIAIEYPFSSDAYFVPSIGVAGATPFFLAAAAADVEVMRALVAGGADPWLATKENTTPLMVAAGVGRVEDRSEEETKKALEAVKLAVELGSDVNATNDLGKTALHGAAFTGANAIIQFLVEKGAKLDTKNIFGETALIIALGDPDQMVSLYRAKYGGSVRAGDIVHVIHNSSAELLLKLGATPLNSQAATLASKPESVATPATK